MVIVDTDVLSELMRSDTGAVGWLDRQPSTSVWTTSITIMEIRYGLAIMPTGRRQLALINEFERVIDEELQNRVLPFDTAAAEETASLMSRRRASGKRREIRDTMIAGIALAQRASLATRNVRHFDDLSILVVDPWTA